MSYPHLTPEAANECSRAAVAYSPDCFCVVRWAYGDFPPTRRYHGLATKWLEAAVWRSGEGSETDRYVLSVSAETGPDLLRRLREALAAVGEGTTPDPSLLAPDHHQALLSRQLRHPLLPAGQLLHALDELGARLPTYEAARLTQQLGRAIDERQAQAHCPPEGGGWIASAPRTTCERPAFPTGPP